eukprot:CAMPEP_0206283180 /NCGR_PEP_ID=MMETSP0047_2-20121206/40083_1 /ASSEMBLY_ACC=CAM_ASM_000192 /TAXON_ID=195065 /ORGANISM="Chroomonas mesostigmatica_cf, Strain CCMP1168" /LENGTH=250 /DNA_ID=CAMNT_0053713509 /DNA_START=260 /DNA_END=1009 /DNA_ORIENTATION=-
MPELPAVHHGSTFESLVVVEQQREGHQRPISVHAQLSLLVRAVFDHKHVDRLDVPLLEAEVLRHGSPDARRHGTLPHFVGFRDLPDRDVRRRVRAVACCRPALLSGKLSAASTTASHSSSVMTLHTHALSSGLFSERTASGYNSIERHDSRRPSADTMPFCMGQGAALKSCCARSELKTLSTRRLKRLSGITRSLSSTSPSAGRGSSHTSTSHSASPTPSMPSRLGSGGGATKSGPIGGTDPSLAGSTTL